MDVLQLQSRLNNFSVEDELRRIVFDNKEMIIKMNQDNLFKGKDTDGNIIGVYSPFTENFTKGKSGRGFPKRAFEPYNLFNTGKLHDSITVDYKRGIIKFRSVDGNLSEIFNTIKKHGFIDNPKETLFGLTVKDNKILSFQFLLPQLQTSLKRAIGQ